jgi:hypothetical protein
MSRFCAVLFLTFPLLSSLAFGQAPPRQPSQPLAPAAPQAQPASHGQHPAPPEALYHRLICLVHLTGSGKLGDPRRPEYVPSALTGSRSEILAWAMQIADDGQMAIVHYVAADRTVFAPILADTRAEIRVFEIGKDKPEAIEAEMRKFKKDFTLADFKVVTR